MLFDDDLLAVFDVDTLMRQNLRMGTKEAVLLLLCQQVVQTEWCGSALPLNRRLNGAKTMKGRLFLRVQKCRPTSFLSA